jgi:hypothetical protein
VKERGQQKGEEKDEEMGKKRGGWKRKTCGYEYVVCVYICCVHWYIVAYICVPFDACTRLMFICGTKTYVVLIRYTLF